MASSQRRNGQTAPGGDEMMAQPQVFDMMVELNHIRRTQDGPTSVDDQAQRLGMTVDWQQSQKQAHRRALMTVGDAEFDNAAMEEAVRATKRRRTDLKKIDLEDARKMYTCGPEEDLEPTNDPIDGLTLDTELLGLSNDFEGEFSDYNKFDLTFTMQPASIGGPSYKPGFDLLESICSHIWLATEVGKHMRPRDIVNLFSVSRSFHYLIKQHWQSTIIAWGEHMAPSSLKIFFWKFYAKYTIQDPTGTTWAAPGPFMDSFPRPAWATSKTGKACDANIRLVPGLKYLAMIVERETRVRDILACLARSGHRLPGGAHRALKKIWLLMDIATNGLRRAFIQNQELWRAEDLYNAQALLVKLQMRFNEPVFGPDSPALLETLMGSQAGLTPLWELLRGTKYRDNLLEVMQDRLRYHCEGDAAARHRDEWEDYLGVPAWDLGFGHLEGWGQGHVHLSRPDELVVEEAVRRGIGLQDHLIFMVFWGHVDWRRRVNIVPSEEDMYMSDDELPPNPTSAAFAPVGGKPHPATILHGRCGNVPFEYGDWQPIHALKARWDTLTDEEKEAINQADRSDELKMLPWDCEDEGFFDPDSDEEGVAGRHHDNALLEEDDCDCEEECGGMCAMREVVHTTTTANVDDDEIMSNGSSGDEDDTLDSAPAGVTEQGILEIWDKLEPEQKRQIAAAHRELRLLQRRAAGTTAAPRKKLYPRGYQMSDPTCLALLRKYDVFPHEMFDNPLSEDEEEDEEEEEEQEGVEEDNDDDGDLDDEGLKALADEEYSDDDDVIFDVDRYKSYLAEAGERCAPGPCSGGEEDISGDEAHEADVDGKATTKIPMYLTDVRYF